MSQASHVDKQVCPGGNGILIATYRDATAMHARSYMVIKLNTAMQEIFRLHNTLFPDEDSPEVAAYWPASMAWGNTKGPARGSGSFIHPCTLAMAATGVHLPCYSHSHDDNNDNGPAKAGHSGHPQPCGVAKPPPPPQNGAGVDLVAWSLPTFIGMQMPYASCPKHSTRWQLIAIANKDLCTANILNGNMVLQPIRNGSLPGMQMP